MGIIEWLLVWLIVDALFVVWRFSVTTEVEAHDRSVPAETPPAAAPARLAHTQLQIRDSIKSSAIRFASLT